MKLTPKGIDHLPNATDRRYEVRDTLIVGLVLRVSSTGGKVWCLVTRVNGHARRMKLGTYPILTLADAREKARDLLRDVQLGRLVEAEKPELRVPSLGDVMPQFIELYAKPRNRDWRGTERLLTKFQGLENRPIDQIKRPDIVSVLDGMISSGAPSEPIGRLLPSRSCLPGALTGGCLNSIRWLR